MNPSQRIFWSVLKMSVRLFLIIANKNSIRDSLFTNLGLFGLFFYNYLYFESKNIISYYLIFPSISVPFDYYKKNIKSNAFILTVI